MLQKYLLCSVIIETLCDVPDCFAEWLKVINADKHCVTFFEM